ncbi:hypothetical protein IWZ01DRAFT_500066 [Phyllosticta capitalensis]
MCFIPPLLPSPRKPSWEMCGQTTTVYRRGCVSERRQRRRRERHIEGKREWLAVSAGSSIPIAIRVRHGHFLQREISRGEKQKAKDILLPSAKRTTNEKLPSTKQDPQHRHSSPCSCSCPFPRLPDQAPAIAPSRSNQIATPIGTAAAAADVAAAAYSLLIRAAP